MRKYIVIVCFISDKISQTSFIFWLNKINTKLSNGGIISSNKIDQEFFCLSTPTLEVCEAKVPFFPSMRYLFMKTCLTILHLIFKYTIQ
uniref:Uncharacterized protein n=1 Tax=Physcomitrium patens TaxID=3218 RepID=A0A2K1JR26_PHYPA|nr:hypothetical protein PHYPA_016371 [Physcomitrium patens]